MGETSVVEVLLYGSSIATAQRSAKANLLPWWLPYDLSISKHMAKNDGVSVP